MYRLLVADDEALVREGILAKLAAGGYEFDWIGQAADGEQAYDIICAEKPDIVITDIHMPFVDGIELIRKCREAGSNAHFLIITGYAEFEYAKKALEMGVDGYILKPINDENLIGLMEKIIKLLGSEDSHRSMEDKLEAMSKDMQMLGRERALNQLFHAHPGGIKTGDTEILEALFPSEYQYFAVLLINLGKPAGQGGENDSDVLRESARQLVSGVIGGNGCAVADYVAGAQVIAVLGHSSREQLKTLASRCAEEINRRLSAGLGIPASVSVSGISQGLSSVAYRQAKAALFQRILQGGDKVYSYEESAGKEKVDYPQYKIKLLQTAIANNDYQGIEQVLNDIFLSDEANKYTVAYIRFLFLDVNNSLQKACVRMEPDTEDWLESSVSPDDMLGFFDSKLDIVRYLHTTIMETLKQYTANAALCREILGSIKEYINQHFTEDLQVKDLARRFAINPNYLSTIFRREAGQTISHYLTVKKLDMACHLLTATKSSIVEIAQTVGYNDPQYFYKVFKKTMGVTAMEYRNKTGGIVPSVEP